MASAEQWQMQTGRCKSYVIYFRVWKNQSPLNETDVTSSSIVHISHNKKKHLRYVQRLFQQIYLSENSFPSLSFFIFTITSWLNYMSLLISLTSIFFLNYLEVTLNYLLRNWLERGNILLLNPSSKITKLTTVHENVK